MAFVSGRNFYCNQTSFLCCTNNPTYKQTCDAGLPLLRVVSGGRFEVGFAEGWAAAGQEGGLPTRGDQWASAGTSHQTTVQIVFLLCVHLQCENTNCQLIGLYVYLFRGCRGQRPETRNSVRALPRQRGLSSGRLRISSLLWGLRQYPGKNWRRVFQTA